MSYDCLSRVSTMTEAEEAELVGWLLAAARDRPQDWRWGGHTMTDAVSGIEVWLATGPEHCGIWRSEGAAGDRVLNFTRRAKVVRLLPPRWWSLSRKPRRRVMLVSNQQRVFDAFHALRHHIPSERFKELRAMMDKAPVPLPHSPAVEAIKASLCSVATRPQMDEPE